MRYLLAFGLFCLVGAASVDAQRIALPAPPQLTSEGFDLIVEFETGGRAGYNPRPEWPGFASGVTVGIGYDLGYNSRATILADWKKLPAAPVLATTSGVTGTAAKPLAQRLRDIIVAWDLATEVFTEVTVTRFYELCRRTFPGFDELHPNCQAALVSLVFNRGGSMAGPRRSHMREIRALASKRDYRGVAAQLRAMKVIWRGTDIQRGMERRREAEARLVETAI